MKRKLQPYSDDWLHEKQRRSIDSKVKRVLTQKKSFINSWLSKFLPSSEILVTETAGAAADGGTSAFEAAQAAGIREARAEMAAELEQRQLLALQPDDGEESGAAPAPGVGTGAAAAAAALAGAGAGAADGGEPGGTAVAGGAPAQAAMAEAKAWLLLFFNVTEVAVLATPRAARKTSKSSGPRKRKASKLSKPSTPARLNFV